MTRWKAPQEPAMKVNVDASYVSADRRAITGAIIRDHEGYGASRRICPSTPSAFAAEATTVLHGLCLAADLGFRSVWVESDTLAIVKILNSSLVDKSEIGNRKSELLPGIRR
ncbi:hypothetical protein F3Y22_tig00002919pilonHSYRG00060 [Hibiscus syriacus]|uniref:RNase H type-1 domain-containing protein n=1 Tax=Hibiscus syriacus TaxID=106335 RepID=A0A6A3CPW3_HIBSY|nr:hypothetical protein F3Y22_tig00002919pilonHSYRG00060 [Hibiscus syriacus]